MRPLSFFLTTAVLLLTSCGTAPTLTAEVKQEPAASTPTAEPTPLPPYTVAKGFVFEKKPEPPKPKVKPKPEPKAKVVKPKPVEKAEPKPRKALHLPWGNYKGPQDQSWPPYERARGEARELLSYIALNPKAKWFGAWIPDSQIYDTMRTYIENAQNGNPNALVQMTIFRMDPWYTDSYTKVPSPAQVESYKAWIRSSAEAIGNTRTMLVLQPDGTFLRTVPNFELSSSLIRYAAKIYGALPRTRVYIETGGWDWPHPGQGGVREAVRLLEASGMKYADGVATNTTHYNSVENDVQRVADIVQAFEAKGLPGLKGVINTSSNGNPFEFGKYTGPDPDHAFTCAPGRLEGTCVALGIPPTNNVASPKWNLPQNTRTLAKKYVDAYLWLGRPWLYRQNDPFLTDRALELVRAAPYR